MSEKPLVVAVFVTTLIQSQAERRTVLLDELENAGGRLTDSSTEQNELRCETTAIGNLWKVHWSGCGQGALICGRCSGDQKVAALIDACAQSHYRETR